MSRGERRALIEREDPALPIFQQCRLLAVLRSSVYRRPAEVSEEDRAIMALIDRQYLARPYYGSRRMAAWLATQGHLVNRKRVQRLMRLMGLVAVYQRPKHEQAGARERGLPVSARRAVDSAGQPGLVPTSPISRWPGAFFTWWSSWIAAPCWRGSCPTRSAPTFVSRPWRRPWHSTASLKSSTRRLPVHQHRVHRRARSIRHHDQHGWEGALHGQHLRRTTVAKPEIRGGLLARLCQRRRGDGRDRCLAELLQ
jgi:putative transposase